jgi:hypothetical protein
MGVYYEDTPEGKYPMKFSVFYKKQTKCMKKRLSQKAKKNLHREDAKTQRIENQ